ncbi:sugar phosphate isomerase/epimerase family protein [Psychromicrobium lacuslunae]|uniref:Xylose isomerase-like TIM barrel domain-containing protein n=1 Tax=Psychromicrobium lacuslunae TaxID=1618207 RepID=A0A0D4C0P0_9MICC|nr:sugar phosphate isomerase/epimerase family protein [Psychromicrobium lacuslunae]AJT42242.1 hypothetical protein UM93_13410 [Psychromicrobium lacuslunae]
MPLAFSTLGCPSASLDEVFELANRFGVRGLELRSGDDQLVHPGLSPATRTELRRRCQAQGLHLLSVASYLRLLGGGVDNDLDDAEAQLTLAADLQAYGLRVFPGGATDQPVDTQSDQDLLKSLLLLSERAAALGVKVLVETHDQYRRGRDLARVLLQLDKSLPGHQVRVIWDLRHSWQAGELPSETYQFLRPWLGYLQLKDLRSNGELVLPGQGELPLRETVALLGADSWYSLEWEAAWHPELPPLGAALEALAELKLFSQNDTELVKRGPQ